MHFIFKQNNETNRNNDQHNQERMNPEQIQLKQYDCDKASFR